MAENALTPDQVVEKINGLITEKMASTPSMDDVNNIKSELESLKGLESKSNEIEKAIAKMEGKLEAMSEKSMDNGKFVASIGEQVTKNMSDKLDALKSGRGFDMEVKADTTITGDYTGTRALSELDTNVNRIARQAILLQNVVNRGITSSKFVTYILSLIHI